MSKLQELIEKHCPDGVEYVVLGDACFYPKVRVAAEDIGTGGYASVENLAQNFAGRTGVDLELTPEAVVIEYLVGDVLVGNIRPYLKKVWLADADGGTNGDVLVFRIAEEFKGRLLPEFLYVQLASNDFIDFDMKHAKGVKMPRGDKKAVLRYRIPVPPIEVQREIVRLLDAYTVAHDALVAKLNEDYVYQQITFDTLLHEAFNSLNGVEWRALSDVSLNVMSGGTPSKSHPEYYDGEHLWLRTQEVDFCEVSTTGKTITDAGLKNSAAKIIPAGCLIVAMYGATAAKVAINTVPMTTNQACCNLEFDKDKVLVKYAFYWMMLNYENLKAMGRGSQSNISAAIVKGYKIPVVSMAEQKRLISLMDELRSLTEEAKAVVEHEIELWEIQLTEFRNQLLSFPEKAA